MTVKKEKKPKTMEVKQLNGCQRLRLGKRGAGWGRMTTPRRTGEIWGGGIGSITYLDCDSGYTTIC